MFLHSLLFVILLNSLFGIFKCKCKNHSCDLLASNLLNSEIRPTIIPRSVNYFPVYSTELPCSYSLREGVLFNLQHIQIFPKYNSTKSQIQFVCLLDRFQASRLSKFTRRCYGNLTGTLTEYNLWLFVSLSTNQKRVIVLKLLQKYLKEISLGSFVSDFW